MAEGACARAAVQRVLHTHASRPLSCVAGKGVWHRLNDSVTSRISSAEARSSAKQRECYLLFYVLSG